MCKVQCGSDMSLMNRLPRCYCKNQPPAELQNVTGIRPRGQAEAAWLRTTPTIAIAVVRNRLYVPTAPSDANDSGRAAKRTRVDAGLPLCRVSL